jgi:DNA-binding HxlR family transcriptional regulator
MALLDLLGRRRALRVIWEPRDGPLSFRETQARCGAISTWVLNDRLAEV